MKTKIDYNGAFAWSGRISALENNLKEARNAFYREILSQPFDEIMAILGEPNVLTFGYIKSGEKYGKRITINDEVDDIISNSVMEEEMSRVYFYTETPNDSWAVMWFFFDAIKKVYCVEIDNQYIEEKSYENFVKRYLFHILDSFSEEFQNSVVERYNILKRREEA